MVNIYVNSFERIHSKEQLDIPEQKSLKGIGIVFMATEKNASSSGIILYILRVLNLSRQVPQYKARKTDKQIKSSNRH